MSSKTRYYLEQIIPELDDLVDKKIFTKNEVSMIMKKRTNFEHRLNSRGSSVNDYLRYIQYEKSVNRLRTKRVKRLLNTTRTNSISDWSIIRRIKFIFKRGTVKFPNEIEFWSHYLSFLKSKSSQTSYKQIHSVYNELLRLHPFNVEIWISSAKYEYEINANFKSCRTLFQNALRFNTDSKKLWYEYVKFELNFITKLINRRRVMNLINEREQELDMLNEEKTAADKYKTDGIEEKQGQEEETNDDDDDDKIDLSKTVSTGDKMKDKLNQLPEADMNMLGNEDTNPALRGEIALTIFDIAIDSLAANYIKKQKGFYNIEDNESKKQLYLETVKFLYSTSMEYIELFDNFKDLKRDYLINHILQYWKDDKYEVNLLTDLPKYYINNLIVDITLNIRYMTIEQFDIDQLQLSVKKYLAYKNKLIDNKPISKELTDSYKDYLNERFVSRLVELDDPRANTLQLIIKKL